MKKSFAYLVIVALLLVTILSGCGSNKGVVTTSPTAMPTAMPTVKPTVMPSATPSTMPETSPSTSPEMNENDTAEDNAEGETETTRDRAMTSPAADAAGTY